MFGDLQVSAFRHRVFVVRRHLVSAVGPTNELQNISAELFELVHPDEYESVCKAYSVLPALLCLMSAAVSIVEVLHNSTACTRREIIRHWRQSSSADTAQQL